MAYQGTDQQKTSTLRYQMREDRLVKGLEKELSERQKESQKKKYMLQGEWSGRILMCVSNAAKQLKIRT